MKNKIILSLAILTGIGIGSILTACNSGNTQVIANEKDYLEYCGKQSVCDNNKFIEVYEDIKHKKVIYVGGSGGFQHPITISVSNLK